MTDRIRRVRIDRVVVRGGSIDHHDAARLSQLVTEAITRGDNGSSIPEPGIRGVAGRIAGRIAGEATDAARSGGGAT